MISANNDRSIRQHEERWNRYLLPIDAGLALHHETITATTSTSTTCSIRVDKHQQSQQQLEKRKIHPGIERGAWPTYANSIECLCVGVCVLPSPQQKKQQVFKCYARVVHSITFAHTFALPRSYQCWWAKRQPVALRQWWTPRNSIPFSDSARPMIDWLPFGGGLGFQNSHFALLWKLVGNRVSFRSPPALNHMFLQKHFWYFVLLRGDPRPLPQSTTHTAFCSSAAADCW